MQWGTLATVTPSIAALLVDASERFLGEALGRLESAGFPNLSVSHAFAMQLIDAGVTTITALADVMRMSPQAVSAIVDQLEARGYVARTRQADDARAKVLALTAAGRSLAAAIAGSLAEAEAEWADLVGRERLADVAAALHAYVADGASSGAARVPRRQRRVRIV